MVYKCGYTELFPVEVCRVEIKWNVRKSLAIMIE